MPADPHRLVERILPSFALTPAATTSKPQLQRVRTEGSACYARASIDTDAIARVKRSAGSA